METIKEFLSPKSFNHLSFVVVIASVVMGIILLGVVADIETNEQRYFRCRIKGEEKASSACFADYQATTTRGFPLYGFVLMYFLLVKFVCFCYSQSVRSKVKDLEREDPEIQTNQLCACRLYRRYCIQLAVRFILGIIFLILQWGVFYPVEFPSEYACELSSIHRAKHTNITRSVAANVTQSWYDCFNPQADKKTFWTIAVFVVIVLLTVLNLLELIYVKRKAQVDDTFRKDLKFFNIYLLNKDTDVIESYVAEMKKTIEQKTKFYEPLVPNIPGEERKLLELDNIYTNLIMYPGRAEHKFKGERHEIFEGYLMSQKHHQSINKIEDIFAPKPEKPQERPLSIMIIGRPGIGKSLLCWKILRDWACGKTFNEETESRKCFEFVYLFKFRHFNSDEKMNLQQLLGNGQFSGTFPNEVYKWILSHPEKVLLIFDGLDEFGKKENIAKEEEFGSRLAETIPFSALYSKLTSGKLCKGATVVTTSRPTALSYVSFSNKTFDRSLEILGFNPGEIEKYVERFSQDDFVKQKIWNHISSNGNLLSLCYVPVNCHIVCFSLQERVIRGDGESDVDYLPTTLTEIYEDALVLIVCKHNPHYRCSVREQEHLLSGSESHFVPEVETSLKALGEIAYEGIEENRLIFESHEVKKHEECGLLHRLPDQAFGIRHKGQYCFLHLTLQELLAARYIVAQLTEKNSRKLQSWISKHLHKGKWEVVMQFVAGLSGDKYQNSTCTVVTFIESLPRPSSVGEEWPSYDQREVVMRVFKCIFECSRHSNKKWKSLVAETLSGVVVLNLGYASLTDADLTSIVFVLQEANNIVRVNVRGNNITSIGCLEVCKLLKGASAALASNECKLTTLNININQIGDDGLKHLSVALATNECKLTTLNISLNQIGADGLKHLFDALTKNECKLTTLDIGGNQIGADGLKHLSDTLTKNECKLTTLDIAQNRIGADGLKHLSAALATNECKLTTLNIGFNLGDDGFKHLSAALITNECKLTTLDISGNLIGDDVVKHLSYALATDECKLTTLDIAVNQIGDDGLKQLSYALATNECKLTTLDISWNQIGDDGLKHLSDALATKECKLTTLDINDNQIGTDGIKHLSDALATDECKLTALDISNNQIGDDGLKHLSDALATDECKLTALDISNNQIGDDGLKHLSDALATNECKLTTLGIGENEIGADGLKHLSDALATKECKLTTLEMLGNQIGADGLKHLSDVLASCKPNCKLIA